MKKNTKKVDAVIITVLVLIILASIAAALMKIDHNKGSTDPEQVSQPVKADSYADYNGKMIGILTGSAFEPVTMEKFPDSEYQYYNTYPDLSTALMKKMIDGFVVEYDTVVQISKDKPEIGFFDDFVISENYSFIYPKESLNIEFVDKISAQFDEYVAECRKDGTMDRLDSVWMGDDEKLKVIDDSGLTGENGTINAVVYSGAYPYTYIKDNKLAGYMADLFTGFCRKYGYAAEYSDADPQSGIAGVTAGKFDIFVGPLSYTKEREESVRFSATVYSAGAVLAVRKSEIAGSTDTAVPAFTFDELNSPERVIGAGVGSSGMFAAEECFPNAKIEYFKGQLPGYEAVRLRKIDAYVFERAQMNLAVKNGLKGVTLLPDNVGEPTEIAVGLSRKAAVPDLKKKIDDFLAKAKADGTIDDMYKRWLVDENYDMPEIEANNSSGIKLRAATTGDVEPYSFYSNNDLIGFDIELAKCFAAWLGADIEFSVYDFDGVVAAADSGDIDCIFSDLNVTSERKEVIDFSSTVLILDNAVMVADLSADSSSSSGGIFDGIITSFEKNFIREDRWKLIVDGIIVTCLITVISTLAGTFLAFLICMFRRTGSALANAICNLYVKLLQGTPMVVLLMILYYIVFSNSGLEAVWVAIIGFSLNFGAYASEIMRSGIESIDNGQREAALALGYSENQAFFRFIFPQAVVRFLPVFSQETVSLLKSTAIVGYIAIQDLTKMSDIIRSRTYEAFFPLIVTAVIYFLIAWIISVILRQILKAIDPNKRKRGTSE